MFPKGYFAYDPETSRTQGGPHMAVKSGTTFSNPRANGRICSRLGVFKKAISRATQGLFAQEEDL